MRRERPDYSRTPMTLLDPLFGWKPVNELFSDTGRLQRMLDFESALARAEARAGIIPAATASTISSHCRAQLFNFDVLARGAVDAGNLAIPMVRQLTELVSKENKDAARFVHWGATSQDAIDTGLVLQLRAALAIVDADLTRLADGLAALAVAHRGTPQVGRTWLQHALPVTFGLKVAGWLDGIERHRARL